MNTLAVGECQACGTRGFPIPLWCPACGSDRIQDFEARTGQVTETTILRHAPGRSPSPVRIGTVRLCGGGVVVARLEPAIGEGSRVQLSVEDGAPVARESRG
jgi:uncharacterized OB-fold protein